MAPLQGLIAGSIAAGLVLLVFAWLFRLLEEEDLQRIKVLVDASPAVLAAPAQLTDSWLQRRVSTAEELL
jgi:hypothetical protein